MPFLKKMNLYHWILLIKPLKMPQKINVANEKMKKNIYIKYSLHGVEGTSVALAWKKGKILAPGRDLIRDGQCFSLLEFIYLWRKCNL